jgi:membrane-bound serine protease (ClpP class)
MNHRVWHAIRRLWLLTFVSLLVVTASGVGNAGAQENTSIGTLDLISIKGLIDPPTADYLKSRLATAERDGVEAAVIQLDTPGGLDVSMRDIVTQILESEVPVVVWVAPRGARAASAGTFIAYAANLVYMAEATEIGAATPISLSDGSALDEKVINDAAAYIRSLAEARGRNAEWAESAVRDAASISSTEAEKIGVIDGTASSLGTLLQSLDGQTVTTGSGEERTLETYDAEGQALTVTVRFQQMNLMQRLLHAVTAPNPAYLLVLIGLFGLIFELYNPGIGLAGILGLLALLLGFYGLSVLPTNWIGVLLIAAAITFFIVDLQIAGFGVWTIAGVAALITGGTILFSGAPEVRVSGWAIAIAVFLTLVFFFSVMTAALRVRLRRPITGEEGIVGMVGEAKTDIAPEGTVLTKGMLWRARTMETGIAAGSKVEVKATEGLVLLVEPLHEDVDAPTS